jgi:hypothetical protein
VVIVKKKIILLFFIFSLTTYVFAELQKPVSVVDVKGKVEVSYVNGVWIPASKGVELLQNDMIRTGIGASARLRYDDGTVSLINENSTVRIEQLSYKTETKRKFFKKVNVPVKKIKMKILKGGMFTKVKKLNSSSSFNISTPSAVCGVRGTQFDVSYGDETKIGVVNGEVAVANPDNPDEMVSVFENMQTSVKKNQSPTKPYRMSESELNKLKSYVKVVEKEIKIKLRPEFVDQSHTLIADNEESKEYEYSVKVKNINPNKTKIYVMIIDSTGNVIDNVSLKMTDGDEDDLKSIKTFKGNFTYTKTGEFYHRYKIVSQ